MTTTPYSAATAATVFEVGQQLLLLPWYQDMMVNRWDHLRRGS